MNLVKQYLDKRNKSVTKAYLTWAIAEAKGSATYGGKLLNIDSTYLSKLLLDLDINMYAHIPRPIEMPKVDSKAQTAAALKHAGGHVSVAAHCVGIRRSTFSRRMQKYGLKAFDFRGSDAEPVNFLAIRKKILRIDKADFLKFAMKVHSNDLTRTRKGLGLPSTSSLRLMFHRLDINPADIKPDKPRPAFAANSLIQAEVDADYTFNLADAADYTKRVTHKYKETECYVA